MNKDTFVVVLSDLHSGGSTALFPNRFWQSTTTEHNHTPTRRQQAIYKHFETCMTYAKHMRKGKRLIVIHDGDAIEGYHHNTTQVITSNKKEQAELHVELMDTFLRAAKWSKQQGDLLYYVSGTETHVEDIEHGIAKDLSAERNPYGGRIFDRLELRINNRLLWFVHHGKSRGDGANEGNALRNWLRDLYWDCAKSRRQPPDFVCTGHTHTPSYNTYVIPHENSYHTIHGLICPSWQEKTRYAYKVAPLNKNEIGAVFLEIKGTGEIKTPVILKTETETYKMVTI